MDEWNEIVGYRKVKINLNCPFSPNFRLPSTQIHNQICGIERNWKVCFRQIWPPKMDWNKIEVRMGDGRTNCPVCVGNYI